MHAASPGIVVAWGWNSEGQTSVPAGLRDVTAIAAGNAHTVALTRDGIVVAWGFAGYNGFGPTSVPARLSGVTAIAAGWDHTLALTSNGVVGWGVNEGLEASGFGGTSPVTAIAAGDGHSVALMSDGTVATWGVEWMTDENGRGVGSPKFPSGVAGLDGVVAIADGGRSVALKSDGTVVEWGYPDHRRLSVRAGLTEVAAIAIGGGHTVALGPATIIAQHPTSRTVVARQDVSLAVIATGAAPLAYQWLNDGVSLAGATHSSLSLSNVQPGRIGNYAVVVTNGYGSVTSNLASLTMNPASGIPAGKLTNFSVRMTTTTAAPALTVGFVVGAPGAAGTLPVLVRGIGPALTGFGVSGALSDPVLTLFQGGTVLNSNDNWDSTTQVSSVGAVLGAFPLVTGSLDAALYNSGIAAGSYTAQITGKAGAVGVALAEIYDAASASLAGTPRLINASARGRVDSGGNILVAGFALSGQGPTQLLIRGLGPALTRFGVAGVLADPTLRVYNSSAELIATKDDWNSDPLLGAAFLRVGAFAPPLASKDAALLLSLQPGSYTAVLSGASPGAGEALIELYEVP